MERLTFMVLHAALAKLPLPETLQLYPSLYQTLSKLNSRVSKGLGFDTRKSFRWQILAEYAYAYFLSRSSNRGRGGLAK
jgi:hypothetical protein